MKLYIGNLSAEVQDDDLRNVFQIYGTIHSATVRKGSYTHASHKFGIIDMPAKTASAAIRKLNGRELKGSVIRVRKALPPWDARQKRRDWTAGFKQFVHSLLLFRH